VLIFSDNVPLDEETSLKREARDLGLLVMGPDCGTAIINGVPLAFANRLRPGPVGIIGASGTGMQEVSCLISEAGGGVSHAIGVGGRDLGAEVGAITTLMAMDALDYDGPTESVVLVSKPPHPQVAERVAERIGRSAKPYTVCFIGAESLDLPGNARQANTLREAAAMALGGTPVGSGFDIAGIAAGRRAAVRAGGRIEGLFCGGTLCAEAQSVLRAGGRRVASNAAIPGVEVLDAGGQSAGDRLVDLGADEYTRGRPHPMIDPTVREELLRGALEDPRVAVVLVDLVIGLGAHPDPASSIATIVGRSRTASPIVVASVTGTVLDPQNRAVQSERLADSGILVAPSNAQAAELALALVAHGK
jgi:succinyl-CoA synthetase alpha subunit